MTVVLENPFIININEEMNTNNYTELSTLVM